MDAVLYNKLMKMSKELDATLHNYFGYFGSYFPYNAGASDVTISEDTTWNSYSLTQAGNVYYKRIKKLTIASDVTLRIKTSPVIIFADEINFESTTSTIDISGLDYSDGLTPSSAMYKMARGGYSYDNSTSGAIAVGGGGGGLLIIVCNKLSGAKGTIKANGGNAYSNATNATQRKGVGGQGALSTTVNWSGESVASKSEQWSIGLGFSNLQSDAPINFLASTSKILGKGATISSYTGGVGGGSGCGTSTNDIYGFGGSGIGGGGSVSYQGSAGAGTQSEIKPSPEQLLILASIGCLGGGGGAGLIYNTSTYYNIAAGGGGGAICVFTKKLEISPTLQANGGTGSRNGATHTANGGAGVTYLITL